MSGVPSTLSLASIMCSPLELRVSFILARIVSVVLPVRPETFSTSAGELWRLFVVLLLETRWLWVIEEDLFRES